MSTALAHLRYFVADAVDEWRHSPGVNLLAAATLAAALFVAGLVTLVLSNVSERLDAWKADLRVQVYLTPDAQDEQLRAIRRDLLALDDVARVEFVDRAEALERFREWSGESLAALSEGLDSNPLPASFEVYLAGSGDATAAAVRVAEAVGGLDGVEEVRFDKDLLDRLDALLRVARVGGIVLAALILAAVVLVMASVLRLAVYARRDEIEIMQLVGASPSFVRGPFLVAGLVQGVAASVAALVLVEVARRAMFAYAGERAPMLLELVAGRPLGAAVAASLFLLGLVISLAGAWFAVRRTT